MAFTYGTKNGAVAVSIQLSNGAIVGTGYAQSRENAEYFACRDALECGHVEAACGHAQYLCERDENIIRQFAADRA